MVSTYSARFLAASLHPNLEADFLLLTFRATVTTLAYGVCGTFLIICLGFVGGLFASRVWWLALFPSKTGKYFG
jgi:phosphonate transport system permease protein